MKTVHGCTDASPLATDKANDNNGAAVHSPTSTTVEIYKVSGGILDSMAEELEHYILAGSNTGDSDRVATYTNSTGERKFLRSIQWHGAMVDATANAATWHISYSQIGVVKTDNLSAANGQRDKVISIFTTSTPGQTGAVPSSRGPELFAKGQYVIEDNESIYLHVDTAVATPDNSFAGAILKFHD